MKSLSVVKWFKNPYQEENNVNTFSQQDQSSDKLEITEEVNAGLISEEGIPNEDFLSSFNQDLTCTLNDTVLNKSEPLADDIEDLLEIDAENITLDDSILVSANVDHGTSLLEIYVYNRKTASFYIHHEIYIGHIPICIETLDCIGNTYGNYCAVGSSENSLIEIWNTQNTSQIEPVVILGQNSDKNPKRRLKKHKKPVICLSQNPLKNMILASGSKDQTIKLWDLNSCVSVASYGHHENIVKYITWHPIEESVLLSTSKDKSVQLIDIKNTQSGIKTLVSFTPESLSWNRNNPYEFFVSGNKGYISSFDIRKLTNTETPSVPLWQLKSHKQTCTDITDSTIKNLLMTSSVDGIVKIWKLTETTPVLIKKKKLLAGSIGNIHQNQKESTVFSLGANVPVIWDISESKKTCNTFDIET